MSLQDFDTLAEAQASEQVSDKKQVGSGQARGYLVGIGVWKTLRTIRDDLDHPLSDLADAVVITAADASSYFGLDTETTEGQGNIASIGVFVSAGILTEEQADGFLNLALSTTYPYANATQVEFDEAKDIGETITLPANTGEHKVKLSIAKTPSKVAKLTIQQRFGDTPDDLTEWHDVASVSVLYKQKTYSSGIIPASGSLIREMRLISPLTLDIELG